MPLALGTFSTLGKQIPLALGTFSTLGEQIPLALGRNEAGGRKRCPVVRGIADCSAGTSHPRFHSVPQELVSCTEYSFRTGKACFLHRMPQKMRRVPQEPVLRTARIFRTIGGRFRYRMPLNNKNPESFLSNFRGSCYFSHPS